MEVKNKILILGREKEKKEEIIKNLYDLSNQHISLDIDNPIIPFNLTNKYFTVDLSIWNDTIIENLDNSILDGFKDIGRYLDAFLFVYKYGNEEQTLKDLKLLNECWKSYSIEIKFCILLKENGNQIQNESKIDLVLDWCIENEFEFVNLNEENDDGYDKEGIPRILEALNAHPWNGLVKIDNKKETKENDINAFDELFEQDCDIPTEEEVKEFNNKVFKNKDDFDNTLNTLKSLKDHASNLSFEERRKLAAKVALSFGLDSEDEKE
ncbi:hypothetical protein K502DRAFT_348619 [Neoconidiobolus thromboides FSU 785]|nr:hypothetical protein K502DRAFT_348619 [Neoconidiobolus thromboides FSU 785]